ADVDAVEKECGVIALHLAVTESDAEVVKLLLEKGANLETRNTKLGLTPLHVAAQSDDNAAIVKLLLEKGAQIESRCTSQERTALQYAAMNGCIEIVKLLI
ncbi:ankyrin, partial [Terfezia boudieri ATCC MYA-4762]